MLAVAEKVDPVEVFEECGHSLALEADERLSNVLPKCTNLLPERMLGR
jgi:hypothetical protein